MKINVFRYNSAIGNIWVFFNGNEIYGISFKESISQLNKYLNENIDNITLNHVLKSKYSKYFDDYFGNKNLKLFDLVENVVFLGDKSKVKIWRSLTKIKNAKTSNYKEITEKNKLSNKYRLVSKIIGQNPIQILVPCHRVIGSNGKLTGYAGGLEKKAYLLNLEKNFK